MRTASVTPQILIHADAPAKPLPGAACNGCGVCCALMPCPLSRALLGHRTGSCPALTWQSEGRRYACGLVIAPASHLRWLPLPLAALATRLARRWIAAGTGCDCDAEVA